MSQNGSSLVANCDRVLCMLHVHPFCRFSWLCAATHLSIPLYLRAIFVGGAAEGATIETPQLRVVRHVQVGTVLCGRDGG